MVDDNFWKGLSKPCPYPVGTRIMLLSMPDDPDPIPSGTMGTVTGGNGSQIWMEWDNGRTLSLAADVDRFRVVT